jgi:hypothetical protein
MELEFKVDSLAYADDYYCYLVREWIPRTNALPCPAALSTH